jgi:uncharacterized protein YjiS (DUF1127 family)
MRTFPTFRSIANKVYEARRRRQTRIAIAALDPHIRKDIGWVLSRNDDV